MNQFIIMLFGLFAPIGAAAFAACAGEPDCVARVAAAERTVGELAAPRSIFESARLCAAEADLLGALADWDEGRARQIDGFIAKIDASVRRAGTANGELSTLLADRNIADLMLSTASGKRSAVPGKSTQALTQRLEELKAAAAEVDREIREIEDAARAQRQSMTQIEAVREKLAIRRFEHLRRSALLRDLAEIYTNRHDRMMLDAEKTESLERLGNQANAIQVPSAQGLPELQGESGNVKDMKRVIKNAQRQLGHP